MANKTMVMLGAKANCFHDATTGITICKGEKVELRDSQLSSKRIRQALSSGHLIMAVETPVIVTNDEVKKLDKKLKKQYEKGVSISKMAEDLSLEQAKALAKFNEVTIDDNDTQETILKAILEDTDE